MNAKARKDLLAKLLEARNNATLQSGSLSGITQGINISLGPTGGYSINAKGFNALNAAADTLASDPFLKTRFSRDRLRKEIDNIFSRILSFSPQNVNSQSTVAITQMIQTLRKLPFIQWLIVIPISNLNLQVRYVRIGSVFFTKYNPKSKARHLAIINKQFGKKKGDPFTTGLQNKVVAVVKVKASDEIHAKNLGKLEVERALNVLRFYLIYASKNNPIRYSMYMGIEGTTFSGRSTSIAVNRKGTISGTFGSTGALFPYNIDKNIVRDFGKTSLSRMNKIMQKDKEKLTQFEKLLLTAVDFYGSGMNELTHLNTFIYFIISLESLVLKGREPIKGLLSELQ